jgi:hypothetical protein
MKFCIFKRKISKQKKKNKSNRRNLIIFNMKFQKKTHKKYEKEIINFQINNNR